MKQRLLHLYLNIWIMINITKFLDTRNFNHSFLLTFLTFGFSSLTWATNAMPIIQLGLEPIPIDVSLKHLNVSSENFLAVLERTDIKALFITNLLGFSGDLEKIKKMYLRNLILQLLPL